MHKGPIPQEHQEIARGSGAAAVLMFLHIAVVGYLAYTIYYLLGNGEPVRWTLTTASAAVLYYAPAGFAVFTRLPTDPLTDKVALVAMLTGFVAWVVYGFSLGMLFIKPQQGVGPWWITVLAVLGGLVGAAILRRIFEALTAQARKNYKKNASGNELPE